LLSRGRLAVLAVLSPCLPGRETFPAALVGFTGPSQFFSGRRVSGRFRPSAPTCRWSRSFFPVAFSPGDRPSNLTRSELVDGRSRTMRPGSWVLSPPGQPHPADAHRHRPLLPWAFPLAGFAETPLSRGAPVAARTAPWPSVSGDAFTIPYPLLSFGHLRSAPGRSCLPPNRISHSRLFSVLRGQCLVDLTRFENG